MICSAARSIDALNCGNTFSAAATTFSAIAVTVRLPPAASTLFAYFLRSSSSAGDVGQVVLRDVRDRRPRRGQVLGRLAADGAHRLAIDRAPPAEVGQRLGGRGRAGALFAAPVTSVLVYAFTSSIEMRPLGPVPGTSLMSTPSSRAILRTEGAAGAGGESSGWRRLGLRPRSAADVDDLAATGARRRQLFVVLVGLVIGRDGRSPRRRRGGRLRLRAPCGAAPRPRRRPPSRIACPTFTLSPAFTLTAVTVPATDEGTSIVALSVSSSRTGWSFAMRVARLHQDAQHVAAGDVLAELGELEVSGTTLPQD